MHFDCIVSAALIGDALSALGRDRLRASLGPGKHFTLETVEGVRTLPAEGEIEATVVGKLRWMVTVELRLHLRLAPRLQGGVLRVEARLADLQVRPLMPLLGESAVRALANRFMPSPLLELDLADYSPLVVPLPARLESGSGGRVGLSAEIAEVGLELVPGGMRLMGSFRFASAPQTSGARGPRVEEEPE